MFTDKFIMAKALPSGENHKVSKLPPPPLLDAFVVLHAFARLVRGARSPLIDLAGNYVENGFQGFLPSIVRRRRLFTTGSFKSCLFTF